MDAPWSFNLLASRAKKELTYAVFELLLDMNLNTMNDKFLI